MAKSKDIRSRSGAGGSVPPANPSSPFTQKSSDPSVSKHNPTPDAHKSFTPKTPRGTNAPASGGGGKVTSVRPKV